MIVAAGTAMAHIYLSSSLCANISPAVKVCNSFTECSLGRTCWALFKDSGIYTICGSPWGEIPLLIYSVFVFLLLLCMVLNLLNKLIRNKLSSCVYSAVIFSKTAENAIGGFSNLLLECTMFILYDYCILLVLFCYGSCFSTYSDELEWVVISIFFTLSSSNFLVS